MYKRLSTHWPGLERRNESGGFTMGDVTSR